MISPKAQVRQVRQTNYHQAIISDFAESQSQASSTIIRCGITYATDTLEDREDRGARMRPERGPARLEAVRDAHMEPDCDQCEDS